MLYRNYLGHEMGQLAGSIIQYNFIVKIHVIRVNNLRWKIKGADILYDSDITSIFLMYL